MGRRSTTSEVLTFEERVSTSKVGGPHPTPTSRSPLLTNYFPIFSERENRVPSFLNTSWVRGLEGCRSPITIWDRLGIESGRGRGQDKMKGIRVCPQARELFNDRTLRSTVRDEDPLNWILPSTSTDRVKKTYRNPFGDLKNSGKEYLVLLLLLWDGYPKNTSNLLH